MDTTATTNRATSDTGRIAFSVRSKPQAYGDGATFHEYLVIMRADNKIVGVKAGPRREHKHAPRVVLLATVASRN